jgi:predicted kinase
MSDRRGRLIVLSGIPATGKSALAESLGEALGTPVFSVDPVEAALLASGIEQSFATGLAAYNVCRTLADRELLKRRGAIIDAVNGVEPAKEMWRELATAHGVPLIVIECVCSDPAHHRRRLAHRSRGLGLPEPRWRDVVRRRTEWVPWREPVLVVDSMDPLELGERRALAWIRRQERQAAAAPRPRGHAASRGSRPRGHAASRGSRSRRGRRKTK